jgi:hypothetical protein
MIIPPDEIRIRRLNENGTVNITRGVKELTGIIGEYDGTFGGYNWADIDNVPIPKILSHDEKHEIRTARALHHKGDYAELYRKYGTTKMERIEKLIHIRALSKPERIVRKTRYGQRIETSRGKAQPSARIEAAPK